MWLKDHSNCPICRAYIAVDRSSGNNRTASGAARDRDDQQQGFCGDGVLVEDDDEHLAAGILG
ncbi:hypothetical protein GBA52_019349 [Prunus armeniaca]|nr:hypothetical protein GBA52_019349 [Prunus armeniaca]